MVEDFRIEDTSTGKSTLCSYTGYTHSTFTFAGVVTAPNYNEFIADADTGEIKIYLLITYLLVQLGSLHLED